MRYVDTSVIVSALDPTDISRQSSVETLKKPDKVVSELVIIELNAVLLRNKNFVKLMDELAGERSSVGSSADTITLVSTYLN